MKSTTMKHIIPATLLLAGSIFLQGSAAHAADYCMSSATGGSSCSFSSMAQCQATVSGRQGWCSHITNFGTNVGAGGNPMNSLAYAPDGQSRPLSRDEQKLRASETPTRGEGGF